METLKLKNPVKINGEDVSEMTYDANEISGSLFAIAEARRKSAAGMQNVTVSLSAEFDTGLHLYMGFAAIIAKNPKYDFADLERMKGRDVIAVMGIGRNFMLASGKEQPEKDSEEPTETTQESITPESESSKKSQ